MKIDHICYELNKAGEPRKWVCQITETDGKQRFWRAERVVGKSSCHDEQAKTEVIDEAFAKFHADIASEA